MTAPGETIIEPDQLAAMQAERLMIADGRKNPFLTAALDYASLGWPVFPCWPKTKKPITEHGFKDATTDRAQIIRWWTQYPDANVAARTGILFDVLDVDNKHGQHGDETFAALEAKYGQLPETVCQQTGFNGSQFFFQHDPRLSSRSFGDGIEIKGTGGYVCLPPSIHPDTNRTYVWLIGHEPATPFAVIPEWVVTEFLSFKAQARQEETATGGGKIPLHQRNNTLTSLAGTMRRRGMQANEILAALWEINNSRCTPPLDRDEVERIAKSVCHYAPEEPAIDEKDPALRFRILQGSEMQSRTPPPQLVSGILGQGTLVILTGEYGTGKSFLALDWSLHIAAGLSWQGHPVEQGSVLYILAEGAGGFPRRLTAWSEYHLRPIPSDFYCLPDTVNPLRETDITDLETAIAHLPKPPTTIVMDTLAQSMQGGDENGPGDMGRVLATATRLQKAYGCTVVLITHPSAAGKSVRGHSSLTGAADTIIKTTASEHIAGTLITLTNEKQKDAAAFCPLTVKLHPLADEDGDPLSCVIVPTDAQPRAMWLRGNTLKALETLAKHPQGLTFKEWKLAAGLKNDMAVDRAIKKLGTLISKSGGCYQINQQGRAMLDANMHSHVTNIDHCVSDLGD
jgi:hypothetical protein